MVQILPALSAVLTVVVLVSTPFGLVHADEDAASELAEILGRRSSEALDAKFRQTKHIALLREPLVSTGRVRFEFPDGLRWEVVEPEPLVVDTRGGVLRAGPPGELRDVPTAMLGPFSSLPGGFSGVFSASADEIAGSFDVTRESAPGAFRLVPKDPGLARALESIELVLVPGTGVPARVVLNEAGGDRSEIEILTD